MKRVLFILFGLLSTVLFSCTRISEAKYVPEKINLVLKEKSPLAEAIEKKLNETPFIEIDTYYSLLDIYKNRTYKSLWASLDNSIYTTQTQEFVQFIQKTPEYGLSPSYYNYEEIKLILGDTTKIRTLEQEAKLDLLLTNAYLLLATHLSKGILDPKTYRIKWKRNDLPFNLEHFAENAIQKNMVLQSLENIQPRNVNYQLLQRGLSNYLKTNILSKSYKTLPEDRESPHFTKQLKSILVEEGYLSVDHIGKKDSVAMAIKRFHIVNGLNPVDTINENTILALQKSSYDRFKQAAVNLEKWKWQNDWGNSYLLVNIPAMKLHVFNQDIEVLTSKVIVGKSETPTPEIESKIEYVVVNPYWHVPLSISTKELLPRIKSNPGYLTEKNYRLFDKNDKEIDPYSIDWGAVTPSNFNFKIRQDNGESNALGKLKFIFPNDESIYLHDTPSKYAFDEDIRSFSHGCIRLQKHIELANYLLNGKDTLNEDDTRRWIKLEKPYPIYIKYFSCEGTSSNTLIFYRDIYELDDKIGKILFSAAAEKGIIL